MKFSKKYLEKVIVLFLLSTLYGMFVYYFVSSWSFDYDAVVSTVSYFQNENYNYANILAFNSFTTFFFTKLLVGHNAEFIVSLFYGICAALRFFVYGLLLRWMWFIPVFTSMIVMLDFNTSRYSLAVTVFIFFFGVWRRNHFKNIGVIKVGVLTVMFIHLHHFAVAFAALFSKTSYLFRTLIIGLVPITVAAMSDTFSRFLNLKDPEGFPRIAIIYLMFTLFLIVNTKIKKSEFKVLYSIIVLLGAFQLMGVQFSNVYYARFFFLAFDVTLIMIALNTRAVRVTACGILVNERYLRVLGICIVSALYQFILINGNIWRFF